jgi:hypothetical protein
LPDVDATIAAALISGGVGALGIAGTVVTSVVGSKNTRQATERTVEAGTANNRATLSAAREDRLWEKRAAAYEETLEALLYRQQKRQNKLRMYRLDEDSEQKITDLFASYEPSGWFEAQARLVAYASDAVLDAYEVSQRADREVLARYQKYQFITEDNVRAAASGGLGSVHDSQTVGNALKAINPALREAADTDEALIKVIRDELRSRPAAVMPLPIVPAVRRGLLRRRKALED